MYKKSHLLAFPIIALFVLVGCKQESPPEIEPQQTKIKKKAPIPVKWSDEVYGDEEIFSGPRFQFKGNLPKEKPTIWTSRLDGSDLRRTVTYELLYSLEGSGLNPPFVRSPDNRYLAINMMVYLKGTQKRIIDLKTKEVIIIAEGGYQPMFQWTPDSKILVFYMDGDMWEYDVHNRKLKKRNMIYSRGFSILPDGKILAGHKQSYSLHTFDGKKIEEIKLDFPDLYGKRFSFSKNGRYIAFLSGKSYIIDRNLNNPIYAIDDGLSDGVFLDSKFFYYISGRRGISRINLNSLDTKLISLLIRPPLSMIGNSIINQGVK